MNIAFPAFFLLVLILPGFVFLSSYSHAENTKLDHRAFDSSSASALFIAGILHLLWSTLASLLGYPINFELCTKLLTGLKLTTAEITLLSANMLTIANYFISVFLFAWLSGVFTRKAVIKLFPYKDSILAFDTPWYYELKGFISREKDAQLIELSCLCDNQDGSYLYYGILEDFYLDNQGQLDRLVLSNVYRRKLSQDNETSTEDRIKPIEQDERYYKVRGDRFMLKYSEVSNINIEYSYIYPAEPQDEAEQEVIQS